MRSDLLLALDLGTTTLAMAVLSPEGDLLGRATALNSQARFGADVISRIQFAAKGRRLLLQSVVCDAIRDLILSLTGGASAARMTVVGNPTMLHLLAGEDPSGMGQAPFTPAFLEARTYPGADLTLPVGSVTLLPSASAFVGADILAGAYYLGLHKTTDTTLLADLGTNGELLLCHGGNIYAASTAAGPALEGAGISCGMGGVAGAIDHVQVVEGDILSLSTIDSAPVRGLCGSGLVDTVALLRGAGLIDHTGAWTDASSPLARYRTDDGFSPARGIVLRTADIRALQVAKAAIAAGIETLTQHIGIRPTDLSALLLAGGLGYYMNSDRATAIGLLPGGVPIRAVGNTALAGACLALTEPDALTTLTDLAARVHTLSLATSPHFARAFVAHMNL